MKSVNRFAHQVCVATTSVLAALSTTASAQWLPGPSMDIARNGFGAVVDPAGRVHAIGGGCCGNPSGGTISLASTSVLANGVWSPGATLSQPRNGLGVAIVNGFAYAISGGNDSTLLRSVERLDTTSPGASWVTGQVPDLPEARVSSAVAVDRIGRIWVIGGFSDTVGQTSTAFMFDPARPGLGWRSGPSLNTPRRAADAVALPDGRIVVIGGTTANGGHVASVEILDPLAVNPSWEPGVPIPTGRVSATANVGLGADGAIYYAGGWLPGYTTTTLRFSFITQQWTVVDALAVARNNLRLVTLPNGRMLAMGGDAGFQQTSTVEVLDTNSCLADLTDDTVVDFNDLLEYLNRFNAGCP